MSNKSFEIIGKAINENKGDNFLNVNIQDRGGNQVNIKISNINEEIVIGRIYRFRGEIKYNEQKEKTYYEANDILDISYLEDKEKMYKYYENFFKLNKIDFNKIRKNIEDEIEKIKNETIKIITSEIYYEYKEKFYTHPAGVKLHHAYVGGLSYHTKTMLEAAKRMTLIYPFLNRDLLVAGVILHDIEKVNEITGVDGEYTKEGLLIGHINMLVSKIDLVASRKGLEDTEEVLCLKHMILAHHGIPQFGSPKRPQLAEALILWYVDTIDSKISVIGEELSNTIPGSFTQNIFVADRVKYYRPKFCSQGKKKAKK